MNSFRAKALVLFAISFISVPIFAQTATFDFLAPIDNPATIASNSATIQVLFSATSSQLSNIKLIAGLPNGGFESGLANWSLAPASSWSIDSSTKQAGSYSAKTTTNKATISRNLNLSATTLLSFYWRSGGGHLSLSDNGQSLTDSRLPNLTSGWQEVRAVLAPGSHRLVWTWTKDVAFGTSAGWLDTITLNSINGFEQNLSLAGETETTATYQTELTGLPEGATNFVVTANIAGVNATSSARAVILNPSSPQVTITGVPTTYCVDRSVKLTVTGSQGVVYYKYRLDGGAWSASRDINETLSLTGLSTGSHTVAMIAGDAGGNWQITPNSESWTISIPPVLPEPAPVVTTAPTLPVASRGSSRVSPKAETSSIAPAVLGTSTSRVLNNSPFFFKRNLTQGLEGEEVLELQKVLKAKGFLKQLTGYYGTATAQAVKAFQKKNKIRPVNGQTGPLTRGVLNKLIK